ncbi:MAG TPA: hypothetical protein VK750_01710, partial [Cytophagaceae bacterium]|nr:hypothetical protein [Cytophagaceae bacterium]
MNNIKTNLLFLILIAFIFVMYMMLWFVESFDVFHWVAYRYSITGERLDVLTRYINGDTWTKLKWAIAIVFLFISYLFYFDRNIFKDHLASFRLLYQTIKEELKNIQTVNVYLITIVGFLFFIFLLIYSAVTPLQLDELDTWLFFIDKGPLVTMAYYPSNNNHIAYNLLSVFWSCFLSPVWTVRMVSMLSGTGVVFLFYLILKRRYDTVFSFAGILLLISSAPFVAYAIQGRGYVLELLGLMLFLYVLWHMEPSIYTDRLLVVCNTFIVYVVPVAILPLGLLNMYYAYHLVKEDTKNTKRIFQMAFYSGMFILICYAPVWIFSGFNQILNNPFVRRISFQEAPHEALFTYGPELWNFISGCESNLNESLFLILCIGSLVMLF